jgi:glycine/D-amino acid oxidase-like deaminating enzyme
MTSFWLEDVTDDVGPRAPLDGSRSVDVAIIGAGFTGLWTARELRRRDPSRSVLVCEAETAGFGASGRNGAWLSAWLAVGPHELARRSSPSAARATIGAMRRTIDEVADACAQEGIDAQIRRGGMLRVARGRHEVPALTSGYRALADLGVADGLTLLDADELASRVRISDAHGALHDPHAAAIHPGRLVRGLARAVERLGATIVESTPAIAIDPGAGRRQPVIRTPRGDVTADVVLIATEAWTARLPTMRRSVVPLYSLIVLTEPIDDALWDRIGWHGHELLASHRYTVDYLSRTADGRVLFGGRGAPYHYGSRIDPAYDTHAATHAILARHLRAWFPALVDVRIPHAWGGPLGMPRDWLPSIWLDRRTGIGAAYGYTGQGVATSNLAGRALADLVLDRDSDLRALPFVGHRSRRWEPEPARWLAIRTVQRALKRIDDRGARTGRAPTGRSLAERIARH